MVAKINIGSNLYGALAYNQEKVDEGLGKILGSNLVFEPADGQFNVVWKTPGPVKAAPWSPYIPGNDKKKDEPEGK